MVRRGGVLEEQVIASDCRTNNRKFVAASEAGPDGRRPRRLNFGQILISGTIGATEYDADEPRG